MMETQSLTFCSGLSVQWVAALFVKLILQFEALRVCFHGAEGLYNGLHPILHIPLSQFLGCSQAFAGIVIRKAGVPPDACVGLFGQTQAVQICAGFGVGAVEMNQVRARDDGVGGFVFARMIIDAGGFLGRTARLAAFAIQNIQNIVVRAVELRLSKVGKQMLIAAMTVDDDYLFTAVAGHLVGGFL
jgi:hypothetical protein